MAQLLSVLRDVKASSTGELVNNPSAHENIESTLMEGIKHLPEWTLSEHPAYKWIATKDLDGEKYSKAAAGLSTEDLIFWLVANDIVESLENEIKLIRTQEPDLGTKLSLQLF